MNELRTLSDTEFHETFLKPMRNITESANALVDIWPYAEAVLERDFAGLDCREWDVTSVYENGDQKYQHILIGTNVRNVFLVIVIDAIGRSIFGHHILDLNAKYGLSQ